MIQKFLLKLSQTLLGNQAQENKISHYKESFCISQLTTDIKENIQFHDVDATECGLEFDSTKYFNFCQILRINFSQNIQSLFIDTLTVTNLDLSSYQHLINISIQVSTIEKLVIPNVINLNLQLDDCLINILDLSLFNDLTYIDLEDFYNNSIIQTLILQKNVIYLDLNNYLRVKNIVFNDGNKILINRVKGRHDIMYQTIIQNQLDLTSLEHLQHLAIKNIPDSMLLPKSLSVLKLFTTQAQHISKLDLAICPHLVKIHIQKYQIDTLTLPYSLDPNLLNVYDCRISKLDLAECNAQQVDISYFVKLNTIKDIIAPINMKELALSTNHDLRIQILDLSQCIELNVLDIQNYTIHNLILPNIANLDQINILDLTGDQSSVVQLMDLSRCGDLHKIDIEGYKIGNLILPHTDNLDLILSGCHITKLDMTYCSDHEIDIEKAIEQNTIYTLIYPPGIQEIHLSAKSDLRIENLNLSRCKEVGEMIIKGYTIGKLTLPNAENIDIKLENCVIDTFDLSLIKVWAENYKFGKLIECKVRNWILSEFFCVNQCTLNTVTFLKRQYRHVSNLDVGYQNIKLFCQLHAFKHHLFVQGDEDIHEHLSLDKYLKNYMELVDPK